MTCSENWRKWELFNLQVLIRGLWLFTGFISIIAIVYIDVQMRSFSYKYKMVTLEDFWNLGGLAPSDLSANLN